MIVAEFRLPGEHVRERLDDASKRGRGVTSGAAKSSRPDANRRKAEEIARAVEIMHIAAAAAEAGATLVTNDSALLAGDIEGLVAEKWI